MCSTLKVHYFISVHRVCVLWNSSLGKEIWKHSINKTGKGFQKLYYGKPRLVSTCNKCIMHTAMQCWNTNCNCSADLQYHYRYSLYWQCLAHTGYVFCGTLVITSLVCLLAGTAVQWQEVGSCCMEVEFFNHFRVLSFNTAHCLLCSQNICSWQGAHWPSDVGCDGRLHPWAGETNGLIRQPLTATACQDEYQTINSQTVIK